MSTQQYEIAPEDEPLNIVVKNGQRITVEELTDDEGNVVSIRVLVTPVLH